MCVCALACATLRGFAMMLVPAFRCLMSVRCAVRTRDCARARARGSVRHTVRRKGGASPCRNAISRWPRRPPTADAVCGTRERAGAFCRGACRGGFSCSACLPGRSAAEGRAGSPPLPRARTCVCRGRAEGCSEYYEGYSTGTMSTLRVEGGRKAAVSTLRGTPWVLYGYCMVLRALYGYSTGNIRVI